MTLSRPKVILHHHDLPSGLHFGQSLAIDNEMMGLNVWRDRLCLTQIWDGESDTVHMVRFDTGNYHCPNLKALLSDSSRQKILYYARGDMGWMAHWLGVMLENVYCAKIASRVVRSYTGGHGLEEVIADVLGVHISKEQQCTWWGSPDLSQAQLEYAANDVLYLHALRDKLDIMLDAENRKHLAHDLFPCLQARVQLDLAGWKDEDIFAYHVRRVVD